MNTLLYIQALGGLLAGLGVVLFGLLLTKGPSLSKWYKKPNYMWLVLLPDVVLGLWMVVTGGALLLENSAVAGVSIFLLFSVFFIQNLRGVLTRELLVFNQKGPTAGQSSTSYSKNFTYLSGNAAYTKARKWAILWGLCILSGIILTVVKGLDFWAFDLQKAFGG